MSTWGFWDWVGYVCVGIGAAIIALDTALAQSTQLVQFRFLNKGAFGFIPICLVVVSLVSFLHNQWLPSYARSFDTLNKMDNTRLLIMPINVLIERASWLGLPKSEVYTTTISTFEEHDNAFLLFMLPIGEIFRLDKITHRFSSFEDQNKNTSKEIFEDASLTLFLGSTLEKGCHPPKGGNAVLWKNLPLFRTIGCRKSYCTLNAPSVTYQLFENGIAMAGFPAYENDKIGQAYFLKYASAQSNSGVWSSVNLVTPIVTPECIP